MLFSAVCIPSPNVLLLLKWLLLDYPQRYRIPAYFAGIPATTTLPAHAGHPSRAFNLSTSAECMRKYCKPSAAVCERRGGSFPSRRMYCTTSPSNWICAASTNLRSSAMLRGARGVDRGERSGYLRVDAGVDHVNGAADGIAVPRRPLGDVHASVTGQDSHVRVQQSERRSGNDVLRADAGAGCSTARSICLLPDELDCLRRVKRINLDDLDPCWRQKSLTGP